MSLSSQPQQFMAQGGQTRKIFCAYHRTEFLTNFCLQKECLMPLCPSCVAEHTQEHYQASQKPTYINLNQGLYEVKQKCYSYIVSLEEYSKKNQQLVNYFNNLSSNIHDQLTHCKQEIYSKIQQAFARFQSKLVKQVNQYYTNNLVYDEEEGADIRAYVSQRIELLYDKIGMLKGDQCLASLIKFYDNQQQQFETELRQVSDYIGKHKKVGQAYISLNHQILNDKFENICQQILNLSYISESEIQLQKNNQRNSKMRKGIMTPAHTMSPLNQKQSHKVTINTPAVHNSRLNKGNEYLYTKMQ